MNIYKCNYAYKCIIYAHTHINMLHFFCVEVTIIYQQPQTHNSKFPDVVFISFKFLIANGK